MMKVQIDGLLQKKMDRKDFLKHVGVGVAALTGITATVKTLNSLAGPVKQTSGYGSSAYGGSPQANDKKA